MQLVVSTWTEALGTVFADAWEVYPIQAWETNYTIPVGENLAAAPPTGLSYKDFTYVYALVMSSTDGNSITITDPAGPGLSTTLNKGQTAIYKVKGVGTTVTADSPVQVQLMVGRRDTSGWEMRGYTLAPRAYWGTEYYAPAPSWPSKNAYSNLYLYNPNSSAITINFQDLTGSGSFTIPAGQTRSYRDGTGRYIPASSGAYVQSSDVFWGIAAGDTGSATWDWGYDLIPVNFLGTDNYVSWAPGTRNLSGNGSPVYVTALNDNTTVFVDYSPNDGVFDATYKLNRLQSIEIYDPDKDNTGMHIVSTATVAVAWGESPRTAGTGDPYLDMGYTTLPLPVEWIDVALEVNKTVNPTQVDVGGEVTFTITISVPSTAGAPATSVDLVDKLPPGWEYVTGSGNPSDPTSITGDLSSGYKLTWDKDWTINQGSSQTVSFRARATSSADTSNPNRNVATATGQSAGATLTADDDAFVDVIPPTFLPNIAATKTDSLFADTDGDGVASPGDVLRYTITIQNTGTGTATGVVFTDTPDPNTSLMVGSVNTCECPGCVVTSGNNLGDTTVGVQVGDLVAGATVHICFQVTIGTDGFTSVANQGTVGGTNITPVLTDDPDTTTPNDPTATPVTIGPPELTITKFGPAEAVVETTILYTGTMTNVSDSTAYNVVLVDQLPAGVTFVGSSHTAVYDPGANTVTWYLGTVPAGASIPGWLTVHISPTVANGTILTDTFSLTWEDKDGHPLGPQEAQAATIVYTHPQLVMQKDGPAEAFPEETFSYQLTIHNIGGTVAQNVILTDTLPSEVTYVSSTPSGAYNAGPPETITWNLGTIGPDGSSIVTVTMKVKAGVANGTTITNTASVNWDSADQPVEATCETIVYTEPKLVITKFGPAEAVVDSTITYTGTLTNVGGTIAKNAVLTDTLPAGVTFVSSSHAEYNVETNIVTWNLGDIAPGASVPGWLTVHIDPAVADKTVLHNVFDVTWEDALGNPLGPNTATWDTIVHTNPLLIVKKSGPGQAHPGDNIIYTISIENIGGTAALNVLLTDILPTGLTYANSNPVGTHSDGVVTWNLGAIPAYGKVEVTLTASVDATVTTNTPVVNTALVSWQDSLGRDYGPANDTWQTNIEPMDFGDLPDTPHPTLLASNGPRHVLGTILLGATVDAEANGQPNTTATGDGADEDGVTWTAGEQWKAGATVHLNVTVTGGQGTVAGWFDWNNNGDLADTGEFINFGVLAAGSHVLGVDIPAEYVTGTSLYARFRLFDPAYVPGSSDYVGEATNGEVEDYQWNFTATAVTLLSFGARSGLGASLAGGLLGLALLAVAALALSRRVM